MLMKDRPAVVAEMWIEAPPEAVWSVVSDFTRMGEWSPENAGGAWLDGADGPALGARFEGVNRRGDREWTTISTVTELVAGQRVVWAVDDPADPAATWSFDLSPESGGTRVVQRARLGPGPSGLTSWIERHPDREADGIAGRMRDLWDQMHTTLEGMKREVEGGA